MFQYFSKHEKVSNGIQKISQPRLRFIKGRNTQAPTSLQTIHHNSITTHGPILSNSLPKEVLNATGSPVLTLETKMDKFISTFPDESSTRLHINLSNQQLKRPNKLE